MNLEQAGYNPAFDYYLSELNLDSAYPGRVSSVYRDRCTVMTARGSFPAYWRAPLPVVDGTSVEMPATGDWCALSGVDLPLRIRAILPRKTRIMIGRGVRAGRPTEQVIAANIDRVFIVTGLDHDFSVRRIERYLVLARSGGAYATVVLTKADICDKRPEIIESVRLSVGDTPIVFTSIINGEGIDELREEIPFGYTAVLLGSSGAGKSSLINALLGEQRQQVQDVRAYDSRGRHTTTNRELIALPTGGVIIDTPGIREVGMTGADDALDEVFPDIAAFAADCKFGDCRHEEEPGCAVNAAVERGDLMAERLAAYHRLTVESESARRRGNAHLQRAHEKATIAHYKKTYRNANKNKK